MVNTTAGEHERLRVTQWNERGDFVREYSQPSLLNQLHVELEKGCDKFDPARAEALLSDIYRRQAKVIDSRNDSLFILWEEFKYQHEPVFAEAFAMLIARKMRDSGTRVGAIIGMPDSGTWLVESLRKYFPEAQYPLCVKITPDVTPDFYHLPVNSLTYTQRDNQGNRKPIQMALAPFNPQEGEVLIVEDIVARGESGLLFLEGLKQMGVGMMQVITACAILMPQGGRQRLETHPLTREVYPLIEVTGVTGEGFGQIKTIK